MWNYDTVTLQIKRGVEKLKKRNTPILPRGKKSSNLEKMQNEYLNLPLSEKKILFRDYGKNKMSGDLFALLLFALNDLRFKDYSFVWMASSYWEVVEMQKLLQGFDRGRIQYVALDSILFRKALETSKIIVTACSLPKYFIKRENQKIISMFGFKSLLGLFQNEKFSTKKATNILSMFDVFVGPLFDKRYLLLKDIGRYAGCKVVKISSYPRFELPEIEHKNRIIFSYRSESFYRCTLNAEKFQDWVDITIAALSFLEAPFGVFVSGDFYDAFPERIKSSKYETLPFARGLVPYLYDVDLLITDYLEDVYVAHKIGVDYIYVGERENIEDAFRKLGLSSTEIRFTVRNHVEALEYLKSYRFKQNSNDYFKSYDFGVCEQVFNELSLS